MLAIIGGSGLTMLANLDVSHREVVRTPYGEPSGAPVRGALRLCLCRQAYNLCSIDPRLAAAARQVRINRLNATGGKSTTPRNHLPATDTQSPRNLVIANALGRQQHNPRTPNAARIQSLRSHSALQFNSLLISQYDRGALIHHSLQKKRANMTKAILFV